MTLSSTLVEIAPPFVKEFIRQRRRRRELSDHIRELESEGFLGERPVDLAALESFRGALFPEAGPLPWLDREDAEAEIDARLARGELDSSEAQICRFWREKGFLILEGCHSPEFMDRVWSDVESAARRGDVDASTDEMLEGREYDGRYLDLHLRAPGLADVLHSERVVGILRMLLGVEIAPFQTRVLSRGSQQRPHSDSIHMTTYPLGYLAASFCAAEDVHPDSGPLVYYPGSHRLPYSLSAECGISDCEGDADRYDDAYAKQYEPLIAKVIETHGLEPKTFLPRKGDVLLWHANLLHGGAPVEDPSRSRRSVVCHYFTRGVVRYHDLAGSLARSS